MHNPFSFDRTIYEVKPGKSLQTLVERFAVPKKVAARLLVEYRVVVNGDPISQREWKHYVPVAKDIITIRVLAKFGGGGAKKIFRVFLSILVVATAVVAAPFLAPAFTALGLGSSAALAVATAVVTIVGQLIVNALVPPPVPKIGRSSAASDGITYFITGTRNSANPYGPVPRVYGTHRMYPTLGAIPYTEVQGDDMYLNMLFAVSIGPCEITDLRIGQTPITDIADATYNVREGFSGDAGFTIYTQDVEEDSLSLVMNKKVSYTRRPRSGVNRMVVELAFPRGLVRYDEMGDKHEVSVSFTASVSYRDSNNASQSISRSFTVSDTITKAQRHTEVFSGDFDTALSITLNRTNEVADDDEERDRIIDGCTWYALRTFKPSEPINRDKIPNLATVELRVRASEQFNQVIDSFNCLVRGLVKRYNNGWTTNYFQSSNPAWAFAFELTDQVNKRAISFTRLDGPVLQNWANYCEDKGLEYNAVHEDVQSVHDRLRIIAAAGHASPHLPDGKWGVIIDNPRTTVKQVFSARNSWGFQGTKAFTDIPHAFKVQYVNAAADYQKDEVIVYDDGFSDANASQFETLPLVGVTNHDQAWKAGRRYLATARLRPEQWKLWVDLEHLASQRGDLVLVNHDVMLVGLGAARIVAIHALDGLVSDIEVDEILRCEPKYVTSTRTTPRLPINKPPIANAGTNLLVRFGATVTLNGSNSSDPEGLTITYEWVQQEGPIVELSSTTAVRPTFTAPLANALTILSFRLTVTDDRGFTDTDYVAVSVAPNRKPNADAGANQNVRGGATVTLNGSGSSDPENQAINITWSQVAGQTVVLSDVNAERPTFVAPIHNLAQTLIFQITVTDLLGLVSTDEVNINVAAETAPVAVAGNNRNVRHGQTVTLNGSNSRDPEGGALTYAWTQLSGTSVVLSNANTHTATFTAPGANTAQTLVFRLTVTDQVNLTHTDDVTITILANRAPTADAGSNKTVFGGTSVTLTGTGSDPDSGDTLTYAWTQVSGPTVSITNANTATGTLTAPARTNTAQTLVFRLTVTDSVGATGTDDVTVTVRANRAPTANAGSNRTVNGGASVSVTGSATDPDAGETFTYGWVQTSGPTVSLTGTATATLSFTAPTRTNAVQSLVFRLTVTDSVGLTDTDTVRVNVRANRAPTARAGADQSVRYGSTVTLSGAGSTDPDNDALTYKWEKTSGPALTLSGSSTATATFTAPGANTNTVFVFRLTVTDGLNLSDTDTVRITVLANRRPVVNAGADQTIVLGSLVTLSGTASDLDGGNLTYQWTRRSGPAVTLSDSTVLAPTFQSQHAESVKTWVFRLTVTDELGLTGFDDVTINGTVNSTPIADAGDNQTVAAGATVTLDGSGSRDPDTDDTITYAWEKTAGPTVVLVDAYTVSPTFTAPIGNTAVTYTFRLTVTDPLGLEATDDVTITVNKNQAPIANAGTDLTVMGGEAVALDGSDSSDPEGHTLTYAWTQLSGPTASLSSSTAVTPTFTAPARTAAIQNMVFRLTVTDEGGLMDTDEVTIAIQANRAPTADAGKDQNVEPGATVTLDGSGSVDLDNDPLTYAWTQTSGATVTLSDATVVSPTFTAPARTNALQTLVFQLVVTSDGNLTSTDTVSIMIAANQSPTAQAGANQTVDAGETVTLSGTGSTDPEGLALTYLWEQTMGTTVTLTNSTSATATFTAPAKTNTRQRLRFRLTVTDSLGLTGTDLVQVNVRANVKPVADAGDNQTVISGAVVTLDGAGSRDPDGDAITYAWAQQSGATVTLSDATVVSPTFTAPIADAQDTLRFRLTVTDALNLTHSETVDITVNANRAPVANAGADRNIGRGAVVTLDGSASRDPDDHAVTYHWVETTSHGVTITNATGVKATFTSPTTIGTALTFRLTVTDAGSLTHTDEVTLTVVANDPPTARANKSRGSSLTVPPNTSVQLDGTDSTDPEGDALTYLWEQTSGTSVVLTNPNTAKPTFTSPTTAGTLTFRLTVRDPLLSPGTDTVTVVVAPLNAPIAVAGNDQTVDNRSTVTLDGTASYATTGSTIGTYTWEETTYNSFELTSGDPGIVTFQAGASTVEYTATFRLTVGQVVNGRILTTTDEVTITVRPNTAPQADAGSDQTVDGQALVVLDASGSTDPEGAPLDYVWTQTSGTSVTLLDYPNDFSLIGANTDPTGLAIANEFIYIVDDADHKVYVYELTPGAEKAFIAPVKTNANQVLGFRVQVTDNADLTPYSQLTDTDDMIVTVRANQAPTANAGTDQTVIQLTTVTLDGSGTTDPDDDTLTYAWTQQSGTTATLTNADTATATFTAPGVTDDETLVFRLTVTDSTGVADSDDVSITVIQNTPPTVSAGTDQTVNGGATVTLAGVVSDPEDETDALTIAWTQQSGTTVTLSDATAVQPTFDAPRARPGPTLVFRLTVTDTKGATSFDEVTITVRGADPYYEDQLRPTFNIPPSRGIQLRQTLTINLGDPLLTSGVPTWQVRDDIDSPWQNFTGLLGMGYTIVIYDHNFDPSNAKSGGHLRAIWTRILPDFTLRTEYQTDYFVIGPGLGGGQDPVPAAGTILAPPSGHTVESREFGAKIRTADGTVVNYPILFSGKDADSVEAVRQTQYLPPARAIHDDDVPFEVGDLLIFGEIERESIRAIIREIRPDRDLVAKLTLVPEGAGIHTADVGTIPAYDPVITLPPEPLRYFPTAPTIENVRSDERVAILSGSRLISRIAITLAKSFSQRGAGTLAVRFQFKESGSTAPFETTGLYDFTESEYYISPVNDRVSYDIRVQAIRDYIWASDWSPIVRHVVIGKTSPPPDVDTLLVERASDGTRVFSWTINNPPLDLKGFLLKYQSGSGGTWENSIFLHNPDTPLTSSPWETNQLARGQYTFLIKAIDIIGLESTNARAVISSIGDPRLGSSLLQVNARAQLNWAGTRTQCFVSIEEGKKVLMVADQDAWSDTTTWDARTRWVQNPYPDFTYITNQIDLGVLLQTTPQVSVQGVGSITISERHRDLTTDAWSSWAATGIPVNSRYYQFRAVVENSDTSKLAQLSDMFISFEGDTTVEELSDLDMSGLDGTTPGDRRLPLFKQFTIITSVTIALQNVTAGYTFSVIDKTVPSATNPGPRINVWDRDGNLADVTIDAVIRGVVSG